MSNTKLVLIRHGQSLWNKENLFTGWTDVDLSEKGIEEAQKAGVILREKGYTFDAAFTSVLKRAIRTLWIVLDEMDLMWIPVYRNWRLNERHYGDLQGSNKAEMAQKVGERQVQSWRRSFEILPPPLKRDDPRHPSKELKYQTLNIKDIPSSESLQMTIERMLPYWNQTIVPEIQSGKSILIVAHGNSLRGIVKHLEYISDDDIPLLEIPTGKPLVYELDKELKHITHYYL